jgi:hypothetical protein
MGSADERELRCAVHAGLIIIFAGTVVKRGKRVSGRRVGGDGAV